MHHASHGAMSSFDPILVVLSILIAIGAGYTALDMASRVTQARDRARRHWLMGGAAAMGIGIWSMHFTGMLAYKEHGPAAYDVVLTVASMLVAIAASWWGLYVASRMALGLRCLLAGGLLMGFGIAAMHYCGMAAMRMPYALRYDPWLVAASIVIAVTGCISALWLTFRLRGTAPAHVGVLKIGAAVLIGIAIAGMHYTGMAAARYVPLEVAATPRGPALRIDNLGAAAIGAGTLFILVIALLSSYKRHMEDLLSAQRNVNNLILQSIGEGIVGQDAAGRITFVNPAGTEMTGYTAEELLGKSWHDLIHRQTANGGSLPAEDCSIQAVMRTGRPSHSVEEVFRRKDGTHFPVEYLATPIRERGDVTGVVVAFRDITERKQAEAALAERAQEVAHERAFADRIIQNTPAAIAYLDRDLVFRWANPEYSRLTGIPPHRIVGHAIAEIFGPDAERQVAGLLCGTLETGRPYRASSFPFVYALDGQERHTYWDIVYYPVLDGGENDGVLILAQEVSERVEREKLQQEKIAALEEADRYKDEFLSVISHELRTPLNFITGFTSILDDELAGPLNPQQHEYLAKIQNGSDRMLALVNNLLDMSRLQAGKLSINKQVAPYDSVLEDAVSILRPLADHKEIALTCDLPQPLVASLDPERVTQVLTNLVENAIKFTPTGGAVKVAAFERDGEVVTEVTDTGPGISPTDQAKLFKPFVQLDMSSTRQVGGTGLGLTISKGLVEAHGGRIGVRSAGSDGGSTFWFTLPKGANESVKTA